MGATGAGPKAPRLRNKTIKILSRDKYREILVTKYLHKTRPRQDCVHFTAPRRDQDEHTPIKRLGASTSKIKSKVAPGAHNCFFSILATN